MPIPNSVDLIGPLALLAGEAVPDIFSRQFAVLSGVYLFTVPVGDTYMVYYVGEANKIKERMQDHISQYLCGRYWLYEPNRMRSGHLEVTHRPCEPSDFLPVASEQLSRAIEMLKMVRILVIELPADKPILRRVESSLINVFRSVSSKSFPLENTRLSVNIPIEKQVKMRIEGSKIVHGLPSEISV